MVAATEAGIPGKGGDHMPYRSSIPFQSEAAFEDEDEDEDEVPVQGKER